MVEIEYQKIIDECCVGFTFLRMLLLLLQLVETNRVKFPYSDLLGSVTLSFTSQITFFGRVNIFMQELTCAIFYYPGQRCNPRLMLADFTRLLNC